MPEENKPEYVKIDDFAKLVIKVGTVLECEEIEGSEKLLKLRVDFGLLPVIPSESEESQDFKTEFRDLSGPENQNVRESANLKEEIASASPRNDDDARDIRQVLSGIKQWYKPEDLKGKQFVFITNLAPRKMMGLESQGMILAAGGDKPVPLIPSEQVEPGSEIR